jgi:hypothetical protein
MSPEKPLSAPPEITRDGKAGKMLATKPQIQHVLEQAGMWQAVVDFVMHENAERKKRSLEPKTIEQLLENTTERVFRGDLELPIPVKDKDSAEYAQFYAQANLLSQDIKAQIGRHRG